MIGSPIGLLLILTHAEGVTPEPEAAGVAIPPLYYMPPMVQDDDDEVLLLLSAYFATSGRLN